MQARGSAGNSSRRRALLPCPFCLSSSDRLLHTWRRTTQDAVRQPPVEGLLIHHCIGMLPRSSFVLEAHRFPPGGVHLHGGVYDNDVIRSKLTETYDARATPCGDTLQAKGSAYTECFLNAGEGLCIFPKHCKDNTRSWKPTGFHHDVTTCTPVSARHWCCKKQPHGNIRCTRNTLWEHSAGEGLCIHDVCLQCR